MGKFSDSPYFLLRDFFKGKGDLATYIRREITDYQWPVIWTDRDYVIFEDFGQVIWNLRYYYDPNYPNSDGSYLRGMETNIVCDGDGLFELWIKEPEEAPSAQFFPVTLRWERLDDIEFVFNDSGLCNIREGDWKWSVCGSYDWWRFNTPTFYESGFFSLSGTSGEIPIDSIPSGSIPYFSCLSGALSGIDTSKQSSFAMHYHGDCTQYEELINNNREVYWRKDSIYHEWLQTYAQNWYPSPTLSGGRGHPTDIRNYTNYDTIFNYFGKIFKKIDPTKNEFRIIFDGLKEYVMRAIPEHQRTPNFTKWQEIFFDRKFHEIYNQLKNIWTLLDPMEVDQDFLGYLSRYYHMFDLLTPTLFRQREFVRDLIWLLKRKGTYVEYYIIWRTVANTINALNVYEKWHERDIWHGVHHPDAPPEYDGDTHVWPGEHEEYIYVEKPEYRYQKPVGGADIGWYNRYYGLSGESIVDTRPPSAFYKYPVKVDANPIPDIDGISNAEIDKPMYMVDDSRILSTHYKVEIDVSTEPLLPTAIVSEDMWNELWQYWEYLRPVNRVVDYNILLAPITDFSGCFVDLYDYTGGAYDRTRVTVDLRTTGGWIDNHTQPDGWPGCAPSGATLSASPSASEFITPSTSGNQVGTSPYGGCTWVINHPLATKYLHTMAVEYDEVNEVDPEYRQIIPDEIEIVNENTVIFHFSKPTYGYGVIKRSHSDYIGGSPAGNPWKAHHYLQENEVISEAHVGDALQPHLKIYGNNVNATDDPQATYLWEETGSEDRTIVPASSGDFTFYVDPPDPSFENAAWIQPINEPLHTWVVPHHLYYRGVLTAVYDWNNNQIHQYEFKLNAIDEATIQFDEEENPNGVSGYAVFIPVGNFSLEQLIEDFTDILRNGATWGAGEKLGDLQNDNIAVTGHIPQTEIYETDDFVYVNITLGPEIQGSFEEFGVYNSHNDMMIYSKSSPIYKPAGTTMVLHFRLEKKADNICGKDGLGDNDVCG